MQTVMVMIVSDMHPLSPEDKIEWKWHMPTERRAEFGERCLKLAMNI